MLFLLVNLIWSCWTLGSSICPVLNEPFVIGANEAGETFGTEGETVTLSCSNEDNPNLNEEFMWLDSEGVPLDSFGLVRPHVLTFTNATRNQSGVYVCVVSVGGVSLSVNTTLIVQCKWRYKHSPLLYSSKFSWHNIFLNFVIRHPIMKLFFSKI